MKQFARVICDKIPHEYDLESFTKYHQAFLSYIHQIPVYGAIILNSELNKVLLGKCL
jgi:UDP-N-acetylmuramate-alanine ligase